MLITDIKKSSIKLVVSIKRKSLCTASIKLDTFRHKVIKYHVQPNIQQNDLYRLWNVRYHFDPSWRKIKNSFQRILLLL